ncbi:MAG: Ldh family oxidoreductase [Dongiaceae bacterium]
MAAAPTGVGRGGASERRYPAAALRGAGQALLEAAGLPTERAAVIAEVLVEADLLGRGTHGLSLLPRYLADLEAGSMRATGDPIVLSATESSLAWDGRKLPGPWLIHQALDVGFDRIARAPVVTVTIGCSHHIACLQAYLRRATDRGYVCLLACADPVNTGVAPHGGIRPALSTNPLAVGIPTSRDPMLIDFATSTTSFGRARRVAQEDGRLPGDWVVDHEGNASNNPAVLFGESPGAILPLGGIELGYKGFGLMLLIEALANGLAGRGRATHQSGWLASVFLLLIDPARFGGRAEFLREMNYLAESCRSSPPRRKIDKVQLPGDAALARRRRITAQGIPVSGPLLAQLETWAAKLKVSLFA